MSRPPVSVTIITLNEEKNLARAMESVRWADEIVVVDCGSADGTLALASRLGARTITRPWQGYGQQKNFAQSQASHDWVLNLDADEVVSPASAREIEQALTAVADGRAQVKGFSFPRRTYYLRRWIRHGGWYPNYLVRLADRRFATWSEPRVHEALGVRGQVACLREPLEHFSFESIQDQILTNLKFARLGSLELARRGRVPSRLKLVLKPAGKFLETYFLKRGFLDGLPGFVISVNAAHSVFLKYAYLFEERLKGSTK